MQEHRFRRVIGDRSLYILGLWFDVVWCVCQSPAVPGYDRPLSVGEGIWRSKEEFDGIAHLDDAGPRVGTEAAVALWYNTAGARVSTLTHSNVLVA
ncbi:hypothetical protein OUZ56_021846 [Daphnia magna]|uniref:Uncharacterized protein n=1 Tax=Daphnia magna TaxID=35525 RepID=A0ABR0AUM5_9CRUS|nr:hypothetical protein OUZ56_021846 [Daphnia magna]